MDGGRGQYLHSQTERQFLWAFQDKITIKQPFSQTEICIDRETFAKMLVFFCLLRLADSSNRWPHSFLYTLYNGSAPGPSRIEGEKSQPCSMWHFDYVLSASLNLSSCIQESDLTRERDQAGNLECCLQFAAMVGHP